MVKKTMHHFDGRAAFHNKCGLQRALSVFYCSEKGQIIRWNGFAEFSCGMIPAGCRVQKIVSKEQCHTKLKIWDIMFEKQLGSVREVSRKLMER